MTPATDGLAALIALVRHAGLRGLLPLVGHGLRDAVGALVGRKPHHLPVVGLPGTIAVMTSSGAFEGYTALAGPTWRNEVCARVALAVALNRPVRAAGRLRAPMLVQVGDLDAVAPASAAERAAANVRGESELLRYPVGHFDVYTGPWQKQLLEDQIGFLERHL
jgi:pimeloyl-ACP methyl ester carboxylesterase